MGISVAELFAGVRLIQAEPIAWKTPSDLHVAGVYVVASMLDSYAETGTDECMELPDHLCKDRWLPGEPILYIGKAGGSGTASTVSRRLNQFYRHKLEKKAPHNGGQDIHRLGCKLWVFTAAVSEPRSIEKDMIAMFKQRTGHRPFANRTG